MRAALKEIGGRDREGGPQPGLREAVRLLHAAAHLPIALLSSVLEREPQRLTRCGRTGVTAIFGRARTWSGTAPQRHRPEQGPAARGHLRAGPPCWHSPSPMPCPSPQPTASGCCTTCPQGLERASSCRTACSCSAQGCRCSCSRWSLRHHWSQCRCQANLQVHVLRMGGAALARRTSWQHWSSAASHPGHACKLIGGYPQLRGAPVL